MMILVMKNIKKHCFVKTTNKFINLSKEKLDDILKVDDIITFLYENSYF